MKPQQRREMITWAEVDSLIDHLTPQFRREFTAMVIITRGGIIPGGLLAEAMDITHVLTAAVDFPAEFEIRKSTLMAWPEFIQFPAEDNAGVVLILPDPRCQRGIEGGDVGADKRHTLFRSQLNRRNPLVSR